MKWLACGRVVVLMLAVVALAGCGREAAEGGDKSAAGGGGNAGAREVVVYCSADAPVARPVLAAFTEKTGIRVRAVYDTEATKTTGLVNRLIAEHEQGKSGPDACDVWWSSEPFGTIRLSRAGVLSAYASGRAAEDFAGVGGYPGALRGKDGDWYGLALRRRVVIYNTKHVAADKAPRHLRDLARAEWKGRVGLARPQFGTTRGHMAELYGRGGDGGSAFRAWLGALAANDVRLMEGNAAVARAVGSGALYVGLVDNDDAAEAKRNGWPVEIAPCDEEMGPDAPDAGRPGARPALEMMKTPNTVAVVAGGAHVREAHALVDFLLSAEGQRMLRDGEMGAEALHPALSPEAWREKSPWFEGVSYERMADDVGAAMKVCDEVLGGR